MKKIIISVMLFFISFNVYAIDIPACTDSEQTRLKELANNVQFKKSYDFDIVSEATKRVYLNYNIDILNLDKDLYIEYKLDDEDDPDKKRLDSGVTKISDLSDGYKVTIYIYAYTNNLCIGNLLRTATVNLDSYNPFYYFNKEKCQDNSDFKYCKEFINTDKSYDEIESLFEEYLKKKEDSQENDFEKDNKVSWYLLGGGIGIIFIIIIVIVIVIKREKQRDDI